MVRKLRIPIVVVVLLTVASMIVLSQAKFGQAPKGERLERIKKSPNYVDGEFKNINETPVLTSDKSRFSIMMDFMFQNKVRPQPKYDLPVVKTNLKTLKPDEDVLIWFGHSSYFIQLKGKRFLIDPVFSDYAAPFSFINKAFKGTNEFKSEDFPAIDYLIITHDHWDHLDYKTVVNLKSNIKQVICGLGVGQHFEYWGFNNDRITELDWYEGTSLMDGWQLTATPARHYSGRGLKGNQTLWASYVLNTPDFNIFIGGDSGYDSFYKEIGEKFGPFDFAILEQGQYDEKWNLIHLMPYQLEQTAKDISASRILPVHNSRFALANHSWDEPLENITENVSDTSISVLTPEIGQTVRLRDTTQVFKKWWQGLE